MTEPLAPEVRALVLAALARQIKGEQDKVRAVFSTAYIAGSKQTFRSPLDESPLGYVQRTDPAVEWRITDEQALRAHLADEFPGTVETRYELAVPGVGTVSLTPFDELVVVLLEHAAHMLTEVRQVTADAITAALTATKESGSAVGPGISRVRPGGELRVVADKNASAAITRMVHAGLIEWDGTPRAITSEQAAS